MQLSSLPEWEILLKKLTANNSKCMVKFNGVTLIERRLPQLNTVDLTTAIIAIDCKEQKLKDFIETLHVKTPLVFVHNLIYCKTNNI